MIGRKDFFFFRAGFASFYTHAHGVNNIGRWTQQQDGRKSRRHRVSAGNALTSYGGIHKKINMIQSHKIY